MNGFRTAVIACACLLLAACGGTTKQASIRRPVALRLARESDAVAAALRGGDACLAVTRVRALRSQVVAAIDAGSIPAALAADARGASTRLASEISCTLSAPGPPEAAAPSCAELDARKQALEAEKHAAGKGARGKGAANRRKQIDLQEHALDQQRKGCK